MINRILDTIEEHDIDSAINRLRAESDYFRKKRILRQIDKLQAEIARLKSCL